MKIETVDDLLQSVFALVEVNQRLLRDAKTGSGPHPGVQSTRGASPPFPVSTPAPSGVFNCPGCGAHDWGLHGSPCGHCGYPMTPGTRRHSVKSGSYDFMSANSCHDCAHSDFMNDFGPLGGRARNVLWDNGIHTIAAVLAESPAALMALKNAGWVTVNEILCWVDHPDRKHTHRRMPKSPALDGD